jgi:flagellar hook-associated protein 3 FlgL
MRISTSNVFDANVSMLNQQQATLLHTNQQVSSGKRMLSPGDDPIAASSVLHVAQADASNNQLATNRNTAKSALGLAEGTLQSVTSLIQDVKTLTVQAGNGSLSSADKQSIGTALQGRLEELIGLANSTDGAGNYLFSGYQGKTLPFVNTALGVQYMGDDGQRMVQVSAARQMPTSDSGADIFMRIKSGNGKFVTEASPSNIGTASISQGSVTNAALLTGTTYKLTFSSPTTFDVSNGKGEIVSQGNSFASGESIELPGMLISLTGTPEPGDTFTVSPSANEGLFKVLSDLITALNTTNPAGDAATSAQFSSSLDKAISGFDQGLDRILTVRAALGARLNELDSLQATGEDLGLEYKQTLSNLQDLDYNKAISDLNRQTTSLQAAQKSFKQVADLTMFNYM